MTVPTEEIIGSRTAHDRLHVTLGTLTADQLQRPSLLPDWTIGHLLAHLVGNGESVIRRLNGAIDGQQVEMYPGGRAGRNAFIAEFAGAPLEELVGRLEHVDETLDELFRTLDPDVWDVVVLSRDDAPVLAGELPFHRWREVEIHLVDLGLGHTPADWSPELVERMLPGLIGDLRSRVEPADLAGWLVGRAPAPELGAWL
ncbi:MAG: maleylpyruvate isomerase family mycothiol-dependent enzyme [Nakamurella sp.]